MNEYLKEVSALCRISKRLTTQMARNTFAATVTLANRIPKEHVRKCSAILPTICCAIICRLRREIPEKHEADIRNTLIK